MKRFSLAVLTVLVLGGIAFSQTDSPTSSTSVWDLKAALSPMTVGGGAVYVAGEGVQLSSSTTSGTVTFSGTNAPFPVNNVVPSWNINLPADTGARMEMRAVNGSTTTAWYEVGRIGTTPIKKKSRLTSDSYGYIDYDTLMLDITWPSIEYRVTLYKKTVGTDTPNLRLMALCYADTYTRVTYQNLPDPGITTSLPVPWRCQYWVPDIGGVICGPTSLAQAEEYLGVNLPTETVAADCYDDYTHIYGNWPYMAQGAAKRGFKSWVFRANDQQPIRDLIAEGYSVILSTAYDTGELTGSPIPSTGGHLILCVGITADGDYIVNDCAGTTTQWDHIVYDKDEIAHAWLWHMGGVAIAVKDQ
jgi:hypothetical protein